MKKENRLAIIYLPNGKERKYCTKDLGSDYDVALKIEGEPSMINIVVEEDGKTVARSYVGIPYYFEIF